MASIRLASAWAVVLIACDASIAATEPLSAARRTELRRSYEEVASKLATLYENMSPGREGEFDALMDRSWGLAEEWILTYLAEHPDCSASDLARDVSSLAPASRSEFDDVPGPLKAEAISIVTGASQAVYVIAVHSGSRRSTILIAARSAPDSYRIAWRIRDVPVDERADKGQLGRWRASGPGWHDGPLDGKVLRAPDSSGGQPRFWVDAVSRPDAGLICPAQISLWRWTGRTATLEYVSMYDAPGETHVEQQGNVLRVQINPPLTCFAPCGACDGPHSTWSLRVRDRGIEDLGRIEDVPELQAMHELFQRVAAGKDASSLAAPEVVAYVKFQYADMRKYGSDGDADCWVGLLSEGWKIDRKGGTSHLDFEVDRLYPLSVEFESRRGRLVVMRIEERPERER